MVCVIRLPPFSGESGSRSGAWVVFLAIFFFGICRVHGLEGFFFAFYFYGSAYGLVVCCCKSTTLVLSSLLIEEFFICYFLVLRLVSWDSFTCFFSGLRIIDISCLGGGGVGCIYLIWVQMRTLGCYFCFSSTLAGFECNDFGTEEVM